MKCIKCNSEEGVREIALLIEYDEKQEVREVEGVACDNCIEILLEYFKLE